MVEVTLYVKKDCHLCEQALEHLNALQELVPHQLKIVDVESDPKLFKKYGLEIPVIEVGPYTLRAPIERKDLEITLRACQHKQEKNAEFDRAVERGEIKFAISWTKADRFSLWLSRNYLLWFNVFIFIYVGLPFLAPVMMDSGLTAPAGLIYRAYSLVCHQLAFRSFFLFGEQAVYPRIAAGVPNVLTYGEATGLDEMDLWVARSFTGSKILGYKVALCERDVAIYIGILMFGVLFAITARKIPSLPWYMWIVLGLVPIGLDGVSQLISQPPLSLISFRESTPLLRVITGWLFGFCTAWFGYPMAEASMKETRDFMEKKLKLFLQQGVASQPPKIDVEA